MGTGLQDMKKRSWVFLIGGVIVGIMAVIPIVSIGAALVGSLKMKILLLPTIILSLTVFGLIQFIVSRKKFQTLKNFYLMAAVVSLGLLIIITRFMLDIAQSPLQKIVSMFEGTMGTVIAAVIIYSLITVGIFVFALIFTAITRQKSKYIKYITDEVQKIAENGENILIEEKGSDELAVLSRSINQMNEDLQENKRKQLAAEKQKNELISNVSHDLRSPLTSIMGYVQLLKEYSGSNDEKFAEYIEVTDRRLGGLNKLINELFELTKMDSPNFTLNKEQGDVTAFVKQFGYEMNAILQQSELNLISSIDNTKFIANVDFERLARVMENLFANVKKYAEKHTDVMLESKVGKDSITISLSNSIREGAEVNTEDMFDRFYRDDQARSDTDSAGLGLAIAKRIIELHGGSISARADSGIITINIMLTRE
jgi:signal transduction histidine kinase